MNCRDLKTEGDHDWVHHNTTLMAFVPPVVKQLIGEPSNNQQVRTVEYVCRRNASSDPDHLEQCGATKTVIIKA